MGLLPASPMQPRTAGEGAGAGPHSHDGAVTATAYANTGATIIGVINQAGPGLRGRGSDQSTVSDGGTTVYTNQRALAFPWRFCRSKYSFMICPVVVRNSHQCLRR